MSFLFNRARGRTNTIDLARQAKELITKLDGPGGLAKVRRELQRGHTHVILTTTQAEELAKVLAQMKYVLQGTQGKLHIPDAFVNLN